MSVAVQILRELSDLNNRVGELVQDGKLLRMDLMGGVVGETKHGRLPRLEASDDDHERRIARLEKAKIRWGAIGATLGTIGGFAGDAALHYFSHR